MTISSTSILPQASISVLEDDPIMLAIIRDCLESQGYAVRCAESISAMSDLIDESTSLIVSDIHVPDGNGLTYCIEKAHSLELSCPIIAITATEKNDAIGEVLSMGADDYIQKPFIIEELLARVDLHLKLSVQQHAILAILEDQPCGIVMIDEAGIVRFSNHHAREWLDTTNTIDIHWRQWLSLPESDANRLSALLKDQQTLGKLWSTSYQCRSKTRYLEWCIKPSPIHPEDRLVYINDQTEMMELKKHLQVSPNIVGNSPAILALNAQIKQLAKVDWNVLIEGETGTGKELVARALHDLGARNKHPFVAVNCAALSESLLNDQLFGHERGAFTGANSQHKGVFEEAEKGTLFLDEIGDLPLSMQGALLRVLEDRKITRLGSNKDIKIDVRLIFATHCNLQEMVHKGQFRSDLYYRINSTSIQVPALRERPLDITPIMQFWLNKDAQHSQLNAPHIEQEAQQWFNQQQWPGNVRQIQQIVKSLILQNKATIDLATAQSIYRQNQESNTVSPTQSLNTTQTLSNLTHQHESQRIAQALMSNDGNKELAAQALGISRATLYRKIQKYNLSQV